MFTRPVMVVPVELVEVIGSEGKADSAEPVLPISDHVGGPHEKAEMMNAESIREMERQKNHGKRPAITHLESSIRETVEKPEPDGNNKKGETSPEKEIKEENTGGPDMPLQANMEDLTPDFKRNASEFISAKREKLIYRIMMYGIPVGSAVLEAVHDGDEVRISSTVSSNAVISNVYPVSDRAETRFIGGRYIISRIRQREGSFTSDTGFTVSLSEKKIFWIDRLHNRFSNNPLPREDVLDVLSGLYYLRNERLEVGKPVVLHLFDSNRYAATTVKVLRKEHVNLPGFREAETIVVQPLIETDCIFRRAGDMLVWLSDDGNRVPVRLETVVPLGRVRADLISAEVERN